jgi:hypothetical protein
MTSVMQLTWQSSWIDLEQLSHFKGDNMGICPPRKMKEGGLGARLYGVAYVAGELK